jgi:hypothetical protein
VTATEETVEKQKIASTPSAAPSKRVLLIASEKGGVGKSVVCRTLVDFLRQRGVRVAAYDADGAVGATLRILGARDANGRLVETQDPTAGVGYYSGRDDSERPTLLDCIESGEGLYIHDLAGGLLTDLTRIVDGGEGLAGLLDAFSEHGYRVVVIHVIAPDVGAALSVSKWLELAGERVDHVAVVNLVHGKPPSDFPWWFGFTDAKGDKRGGNTRKALLDGGGKEVLFPALQAGAFAKLDSANIALSKAAEAGLLTITERAHVAKFLSDFGVMFKDVFELLGVNN